ncbi:Uncharacterised protein [Mycobacterium tuberculosis]|uniref:Uncharacterized protein n=1 Tax=Mycobacterium tuberculosis TaxID=1773 RepID=A0A916LGL0_MYCTX|nr:Uncharacterised protein [Mycobacterium tuberculosis]CPB36505.1 Uncharacterised protein [Mycobacterium tuberculosis]CPB91340.1 Uncharacterised protein [Mycobacterium tuberculosis]
MSPVSASAPTSTNAAISQIKATGMRLGYA